MRYRFVPCKAQRSRVLPGIRPHARLGSFGLGGLLVKICRDQRAFIQKVFQRIWLQHSKYQPKNWKCKRIPSSWSLEDCCLTIRSIQELGTNRCLLLEKLVLSFLDFHPWFCKGQSLLFLLLHCEIVYSEVLSQNEWSSASSHSDTSAHSISVILSI